MNHKLPTCIIQLCDYYSTCVHTYVWEAQKVVKEVAKDLLEGFYWKWLNVKMHKGWGQIVCFSERPHRLRDALLLMVYTLVSFVRHLLRNVDFFNYVKFIGFFRTVILLVSVSASLHLQDISTNCNRIHCILNARCKELATGYRYFVVFSDPWSDCLQWS